MVLYRIVHFILGQIYCYQGFGAPDYVTVMRLPGKFLLNIRILNDYKTPGLIIQSGWGRGRS